MEGPAPEEQPTPPRDFMGEIQDVFADLDPTALVASFICVVEWLEEDGSRSLTVLNTPMPPWTFDGLMRHAAQYHNAPPESAFVSEFYDDFADEDDED